MSASRVKPVSHIMWRYLDGHYNKPAQVWKRNGSRERRRDKVHMKETANHQPWSRRQPSENLGETPFR